MPTISTAPLLLLITVLWYLTKGNVLSIVLFTSVFEAASAVNFGSLGVSPPVFALAVCLAAKLLQGHRPIRFISGVNKASLLLLACFVFYTVCTGVFYPLLFKGVLVMHGPTATPLMLSVSNVAQIGYLLVSALLYLITVVSSRDELQLAISWYVNGCIVATGIAVWQLANAVVHVPYPESILYSNPGHVIYRAYMINGLWRLNSTFSEASEFSSYISVSIGLLGWQIMTTYLSVWRGACLLLMIVMLLMTESSLGYICLLVTLIVGAVLYTRLSIRQKGLAVAHVILATLALSALTITLVLYGNVRQTAGKLVRATLIDKQNSDSYRERTETHAAALETLAQTYYLGAGWGSVRASGLAFVLLGNVGVLGSCIFMTFCASLVLPLFRKSHVELRTNYGLYEQCLFGLGIMLIGLVVAGAEPVQPILWVLFGVGTAARVPLPNVALQALKGNTTFLVRNGTPVLRQVQSSYQNTLSLLGSGGR